jgi:hypothetical protein
MISEKVWYLWLKNNQYDLQGRVQFPIGGTARELLADPV